MSSLHQEVAVNDCKGGYEQDIEKSKEETQEVWSFVLLNGLLESLVLVDIHVYSRDGRLDSLTISGLHLGHFSLHFLRLLVFILIGEIFKFLNGSSLFESQGDYSLSKVNQCLLFSLHPRNLLVCTFAGVGLLQVTDFESLLLESELMSKFGKIVNVAVN